MKSPTKWDRKPIDEPGVYSDIPMDDYHAQLTVAPSISSSGLRTIFDASPAHYYVDSYLNPDREEEEPSVPFILGQGAHHLLLGEADFEKHFVIRPLDYVNEKGEEKPWNSNAGVCKRWLAVQDSLGVTVLTAGQIEAIRGMSHSLAAHPLVRAGILNGLIEHSMVWQDKETGVWLKSRPDAIPTSDADFSDLKTAADISDSGLESALGDRGYHVQGALIGMACREVLGREMSSFTLVFVEKTPPYCARVMTLKDADLKLGELQIRMALRIFANSLERGTWPGPGGVQTDGAYIEISPWKRKRIEDRMLLLELEMKL